MARNVDPLEAAVVSVCMFQAGNTDNVIPQHAKLRGTARSLTKEVGELLHQRINEVVEGTAKLYGAKAEVICTNGYPVLVNHERQTAFAAAVARDIAGTDKVDTDVAPVMGAEDFAFMLQRAAGRLHLRRQRRQRRPASPGLRFQRRDHPARHVLLGAARRNRAEGVKTRHSGAEPTGPREARPDGRARK